MKGIEILGMGKALPNTCLTNEDLSRLVDTDDEWIRSRTGIQSRYQCGEDESCVSLAVQAAKNALKEAKEKKGICEDQIGLIIVATSSGDYILPSVAAMIQKELNMPEEIMSFDLAAACTGFMYGLGVARGLLSSMPDRYAIVVGSEQLSKIIDYGDRTTCILFGDGAAAAVVGLGEKTFFQKSWTRGDIHALNCPGVGRGEEYVHMDGKAVFRFAVGALAQGIQTALQENDVTMDEIDYVVCHQANMRIIDHVKKKFKGFEDKFYVNIEKLGNTSAASIPLALSDLYEAGVLKEGMRIICVGFGAGLTWSTILLEI